MKAMLDANVCIRVLRDRPVHIKERFKSEAHALGISTIVLHELYYGAERSERPDVQRANVDAFTAQLTIADFDPSAAEHAADIKANLAAQGNLIGPNDLLIAGHARSLGLKLITGNLKEFNRVDGLRCEDWLAETKDKK
jgi:tRNA(fMet)-specific endonuclease VapC